MLLDSADTLRFPEDNETAWKLLLHWMKPAADHIPTPASSLRARPEEKARSGFQDMYINCCALGDKYDIPPFQDLIMLELIS
jgi:hypothetical protein